MAPTPKSHFDQQFAWAFEALEHFFGLPLGSARMASVAVAECAAVDPHELPLPVLGKIAAAVGMARPSQMAHLLEESLRAQDAAARCVPQGEMDLRALAQLNRPDNVLGYMFGRAYALACAQEAARLACLRADQADPEGVEHARAAFLGAMGDADKLFKDRAVSFFEHLCEGAMARAERAALGQCAPSPAPRLPKSL